MINKLALRFRVAELVPALAFICFGLLHLYLAQTADLDPRVGGGFGMYAVAEQTYLRAYVISGQSATMINPRLYLPREAANALVWPSERRINAFARMLSCNPLLQFDFPTSPTVRVEHWYGYFADGIMDISQLGSYEAKCAE